MKTKTKTSPKRKCVSCGQEKEKDKLLRVVKYRNEISIDPSYKKDGRGAYVCKDRACIDKAVDKKLFNRSMKTNVSKDIYQEILEYVK